MGVTAQLASTARSPGRNAGRLAARRVVRQTWLCSADPLPAHSGTTLHTLNEQLNAGAAQCSGGNSHCSCSWQHTRGCRLRKSGSLVRQICLALSISHSLQHMLGSTSSQNSALCSSDLQASALPCCLCCQSSLSRAHVVRNLLYTLPAGEPRIRLQMASLHGSKPQSQAACQPGLLVGRCGSYRQALMFW